MKTITLTVTLDASDRLKPQRAADALHALIDWVLDEDVAGTECLNFDNVYDYNVEVADEQAD